jgi:hypothetical protein
MAGAAGSLFTTNQPEPVCMVPLAGPMQTLRSYPISSWIQPTYRIHNAIPQGIELPSNPINLANEAKRFIRWRGHHRPDLGRLRHRERHRMGYGCRH